MKNNWTHFHAYKIGYSHVQKGLVCEDRAKTQMAERYLASVVSDGHGDKNCFRAARGAQLACDTALKCTEDFLEQYDAVAEQLKSNPDRILSELEKMIIYRWNMAVEEDIRNNPFLEDELSGTGTGFREALGKGEHLSGVYGCTLILTVILEDCFFCIQVGDGDCTVIAPNGMYICPIPADTKGCVGNRSTSLCGETAIDDFRYCFGGYVPAAAFAVSDGIQESFDEVRLYRFYYALAMHLLTEPAEQVRDMVDRLLEDITAKGSGDDVSVVCLVKEGGELPKPVTTPDQARQALEEAVEEQKEVQKQYNEYIAQIQNGGERQAYFEKMAEETRVLLEQLHDKTEALNKRLCAVEEYWKAKENS